MPLGRKPLPVTVLNCSVRRVIRPYHHTNAIARRRNPTPSALGVGFLLLAIAFVWWYGRMTRRTEQFSTVTGKGFRPRGMLVGSLRYVALAFVGVYLALALVAPLFVILWTSL